MECRKLAGCKAATIIHKGHYESVGPSYQKLFEYINKNKLTMKLPFREEYIKGPGLFFRGNPKKYLTKVIVPIEE